LGKIIRELTEAVLVGARTASVLELETTFLNALKALDEIFVSIYKGHGILVAAQNLIADQIFFSLSQAGSRKTVEAFSRYSKSFFPPFHNEPAMVVSVIDILELPVQHPRFPPTPTARLLIQKTTAIPVD
jgi:hypothetical protein